MWSGVFDHSRLVQTKKVQPAIVKASSDFRALNVMGALDLTPVLRVIGGCKAGQKDRRNVT